MTLIEKSRQERQDEIDAAVDAAVQAERERACDYMAKMRRAAARSPAVYEHLVNLAAQYEANL